MKYAGNITILDEEGDIVYDRELSPDELIEELLRAQLDVTTSAPVGEPDEVPVLVSDNSPKEAKKMKGCGQCGQPGHNRKTCPENQTRTFDATASKREKTDVSFALDAIPPIKFLEVRQLAKEGHTAEEIAERKNLDADEVELALDASSHSEYLASRNR